MAGKLGCSLAERGQITLPKLLRDRYGLRPGDRFTVIDVGGVFVLSQGESRINQLCDNLHERLLQSTSLEEMLADLRRIRDEDDEE
jgi:AbrB family looped-hinge helix DNA binding protein